MATVLIVEDDPDMREIERAMLGCAGHDVMLAANGREGLEMLAAQQPCVILLDLMMPVMDGLTFLAERRKLGLAEGIPIVCVTAGTENLKKQALRLGARECLPKPTDFEDLCELVAQYCRPRPAATP